MYRLVVLTLRINNLDGLSLIADDTTVTYLSTHLTIEWRIVEHKLIKLILLLRHLTIAKNVAFVFCIVVTYKLLLTCSQLHPIRILYGCSITGTLFLFLHLNIKLLLIDSETVFTTNQFCQVKRETVSIEKAESLNTIKFGLTLCFQLLHGLVKQGDTLIQRTQEGIFLFLHHLRDQLLLSLQFRESIAHLMHKCRHELIEETFFLTKECISITHGTAKNTTNHITCFCI